MVLISIYSWNNYWLVVREKILNHISKNVDLKFNLREFDDLITYIIISLIIGGRLGYVIFYNINYYIDNPFDIFKIWEGGMSFHGGYWNSFWNVFIFKKNINLYY